MQKRSPLNMNAWLLPAGVRSTIRRRYSRHATLRQLSVVRGEPQQQTIYNRQPQNSGLTVLADCIEIPGGYTSGTFSVNEHCIRWSFAGNNPSSTYVGST